jgi:hypothetical protein
MLAVGALILGSTIPAVGDVSVAGGGYTSTSPPVTGAAVMVSTGASIPEVKLSVQATVLVPLVRQGGYAVMGEIRGFTGGGFGGAYIGAGAGIGNLASDRSTGPVLTVFGGKAIAPFTSVEIRLIKQTQANGATAGFLGLRFSF